MPSDQSVPYRELLEPSLLAALRRKYERLCDLRIRSTDTAPRADMAALAREFPGALRELDRVPMHELERRLALLRSVGEGKSEPERWMALQIGYHGFMRAVLRVRSLLLGSQRSELQPIEAALLRYAPAPDEPPVTRFDAEALGTILRPPSGRLNPWVLEQVACDFGVSQECIERALWCAE